MDDNLQQEFNKGCCYYNGSGGYPLDYSKAFEHFEKAANMGSSDAANCIGVMYMQGHSVGKNPAVAMQWYNRALQLNNQNIFALKNIADIYYNGIGVPVDVNKAYNYYMLMIKYENMNESKSSSYPIACFEVGIILSSLYKNNQSAVYYFEEAAKYGNIPEAWHNLGFLCEKGAMNISYSERRQRAAQYYMKAIETGNHVDSMYALGCIYSSVQMYNEARKWLQMALSYGHPKARKQLRLINIAQTGSMF